MTFTDHDRTLCFPKNNQPWLNCDSALDPHTHTIALRVLHTLPKLPPQKPIQSIKIDPPVVQSGVFAFPPSSPTTTHPRPISPRSHQSQPVPIRALPDSSALFCGPALSPPPPRRFRVLNSFSHLRSKSAAPSFGSSPGVAASSSAAAGTPKSTRKSSSHARTQSAPVIPTLPRPQPSYQNGAQHCHCPDRDHPVRGAGTGRVCDLCGAEPREHIRQEGERTRRRGGVRVVRTVRFKLDGDGDGDVDAIMASVVPPQPTEVEPERTVSGTLRLEDERHSWF